MPEWGSPDRDSAAGNRIPSWTTIIVLALVALTIIVGGAVACAALTADRPVSPVQQGNWDDDDGEWEDDD